MSRFKQAVQTAMESFKDDVAESIDASQVTAPLYDVDTQLGEVESNEVEIVRASEDVSALTDTMAGLESICQKLERAVQNGGLYPQESSWANTAIASLTDRIGLEHVGLGLESFGGTMSRLEATKITLESMGEKLKTVWEAIKAMIQKVWTSILKFISDVGRGAGSLRNYASTLESQVRQAQSAGKKASATTVDIGQNAGHRLWTNDGKIHIHNVKDMAARLNLEIGMIAVELITDQAELQKQFQTMATEAKNGHDATVALDKMVEAIGESRMLVSSGGRFFQGERRENGRIVRETKPLPGNVQMVSTSMEPEASRALVADKGDGRVAGVQNLVHLVRSLQFKVEPIAGAKVADSNVVDVLPLADLLVIIRAVSEFTHKYQDFDKAVTRLDQSVSMSLKAFDGWRHSIIGRGIADGTGENFWTITAIKDGKGKTEDGDVSMLAVAELFHVASTKLTTPALLMHQYALRLNRALADVVHRQLAVYK